MKRSWSWHTGAVVGILALLGTLLPLSEAMAYPRPPAAAKARIYDNIMRGGYSPAPQLTFRQALARRNAWYGGGHFHGRYHHHLHGHHQHGAPWHGTPVYGAPIHGAPIYDAPFHDAQPAWQGEPQAGQIQPGDMVVATEPQTRIMVGQQPIGLLNPDQPVQALGVRNGWVGVQLEQNGQSLRGWVRRGQVVSAANQPSLAQDAALSLPPAPLASQ